MSWRQVTCSEREDFTICRTVVVVSGGTNDDTGERIVTWALADDPDTAVIRDHRWPSRHAHAVGHAMLTRDLRPCEHYLAHEQVAP